MRPSFPELMHGLFWLAMAIVILLVGLYAITVLDGIARRMQQSELHHEKLIMLADQSLKDHAAFLAQHDAMIQRLSRPNGH